VGTVTKRCAVCSKEVPSSAIFCSDTCKKFGRVLRDAQADGGDDHELAAPVSLNDPVFDALTTAGARHRSSVAMVLAAYVRTDLELDAIIWAAHSRGMRNREIGLALEMRTSSVQRRLLSFQARLHGPAQALPLPAGNIA
jgi:hypothetical protein